MTYERTVVELLDEVHAAREQLSLSAAKYSDALILALIDVESDGRNQERNARTQFHGILQQGRAAGIDTGFEDAGRDTTQRLADNEDDTEDVVEFLEYCERYKSRHLYEPSWIAVCWKGGVGTADWVRARVRAGVSFADALGEAAEHFRGMEALPEYLRRFQAAFSKWARFVDEQNARHRVCSYAVYKLEDLHG